MQGLKKLSVFDYVNYAIMLLLMLITFYPFWIQLVISISTKEAYFSSVFHLIPVSFSLDTYKYAFSEPMITRATAISVLVTVLGTSLSLLLTSMGAYPLSKKSLKGRNVIFFLIVITMFFDGGLIAWYILINSLGLSNTILAFFIPGAVSTYNLILMKNYYTKIPESLEESAKVDGYNDIRIFFLIILPSSKPIFATITLFYSVSFWNDFFTPMLFTTNNKLYPLSLVLRNLIVSSQNMHAKSLEFQISDMVRGAVIVISIVPIMLVYPFIQKHFVQGIMLGAVKE